jgi:small subunit ribosomal protein S3
MGHKIKPNAYRLGVTQEWKSRWFPKKNSPGLLQGDIAIREVVMDKIGGAGIDRIDIERNSSSCRILIRAAKPGLIIGRGGKGIEELTEAIRARLAKLSKGQKGSSAPRVSVNVEEIKRNDVSAAVIAQQIAADIEKRMPYRRTMKKYLDYVNQNRDVQGVKIKMSGRLDGNEIARKEWLAQGRLPLTTLRANIDYSDATAFTSYGAVGIKVWIYKGEVEK